MKPQRTTRTWQDAPLSFVNLPTCPKCSSVRYTIVRSINQGDGSRLQRRVCLSCSGRYQLVWEPPEPLPDSGRNETPFV